VFAILIERRAREFVKGLPPKTRRIVVEKIQELAENPFPGGDKEKLEYPHPPAIYRLHISRSFTVFYIIEPEENVIKIEKIMTIENARKDYSRR
jgi:mRNA-degrading endonuclease RelE of RelBE toxin-antitoxin system